MNRHRCVVLGFLSWMTWIGAAANQSANAAPVNLAIGKTASASSIFAAGFEASMANNGNRTGDNSDIWHSANTTTDPLWWEVDLEADYYLDRIELFPRNVAQGLVKNFRIDVFNSADANVFSQVFLPATTTGDAAWGTNALRNVEGSRVRITREPPHEAGVDDAMTFGEFEVWGQSTPVLSNLAQGRPVTATPELMCCGPAGAALAVDGNISGNFAHQTVYHSDTSGGEPYTGHFWQVELESLSAIEYVTIFNRSDFGNTNDIRLSILGADGVTVIDSVDTTLGADDLGALRYDLTHEFSGAVGKFVRIDNLDDSTVLAFGEVEVFGAAIPEPGACTLAVLAVVLCGSLSRKFGVTLRR